MRSSSCILSCLARFAAPLGLAAVAAWLQGCTPHIGDSCQVSTDCASDGTRICDTSEPGGFCTVLNCTGTALGAYCPDNALCVTFGAHVPGCPGSAYSPARTATAECRNTCGSDSDCRGGYVCRAPSGAPWDAIILDPNQSAKVCLPSLDFVDGGVQSFAYGFDGAADAVPPVCMAAGPTFDAGFSPVATALDGASDVSVEAASDANVPPVDGGRDAALDATVDAAVDAAPDAALDAADAGADAIVDAPRDVTDAPAG